MKNIIAGAAAAVCLAATGSAFASTFTNTSPTGLDVTSVGASTVGGVVVVLKGSNGATLVSQLAASSLFIGFYNGGTPAAFNGNPGTIGIQTGFGDAITGALGGDLQSASFRFSLYDGDTASGNFDFGDNNLLVNGVDLGGWSAVIAQNTSGTGTVLGSGLSTGGFRDKLLDTGWFNTTNATTLASLFGAIDTADELKFQVQDTDPFDNYYDFTQGIDASLINIGSGPVITPPPTGNVPEPGVLALMGLALAGATLASRRKSKNV